jgi:hypothetical protein
MILTNDDTLLSLEEWRRVFQFHPYRFWQLDSPLLQPQLHQCDDLLYQFGWQAADRVSRASIVEAIRSAEQKLAAFLGYDIAPRYREQLLAYPLPSDSYPRRTAPIDGAGRWISVRLEHGRVQNIGVRRSELVGNAAIILQDTNADGVYDRFTASIVTSVTDASQIAVYAPTSAQSSLFDSAGSYRVRPVSVSISGGSATISGPAWLIVNPELYESATGSNTIDITSSSFLSEIAVYREYIDPNGETVDDAQATLIWETEPWPAFCFTGGGTGGASWVTNSSDPASVGKAIARVGIRHADTGIVTPGHAVYSNGEWFQVDWSQYREPDRVLVRYLEGETRATNGDISPTFKRAVAAMAAAELDEPVCACEMTRRRIYHWQFDLARTSGDESYGAISPGDLDNPFGTRRGQVSAWRLVNDRRNLLGIAL